MAVGRAILRRRTPALLALIVSAALLASAFVGLALSANAGSSGAGLTAATSTPTPTPKPTPTPPASSLPAGPAAASGLRMVQANLRSPNTQAQFVADLATIVGQKPDLMTLNEVSRRPDQLFTVPGYQMFRTSGFYQGEAAVMWRTDRWTAVTEGTVSISNSHVIPKGRKIELGQRWANWVKLVSPAGRSLSLVSVHFAPQVKGLPYLVPTELANLDKLVNSLSASGPVLVGGDLNFNYRNASSYPRDLMTRYNLTPSYDLLGSWVPTGDMRGATIDYQLVRQTTAALTPVAQYSTELKSDHKALTVDWRYGVEWPGSGVVPPAGNNGARFAPGVVRNRPHGSKTARRAVLARYQKAIASAPIGSAVHVVTGDLSDAAVTNALLAAHKRGVYVQVVLRSAKLNAGEKKLRAALGTNTKTSRNWFVTCTSSRCKKAARSMARTVVLVSQAGRTVALRMKSTRDLGPASVRRRTTVQSTTDLTSYNRSFHAYFLLIG